MNRFFTFLGLSALLVILVVHGVRENRILVQRLSDTGELVRKTDLPEKAAEPPQNPVVIEADLGDAE